MMDHISGILMGQRYCKIFSVIILLILASDIFGENMDSRYRYNDNGRIITPSKEELNTLEIDGGNLWNRLVFESSPYLLQHAANPVDWYPWGDEAFEEAKSQNKPIFLSIGYTTCHWCHVMEHESFEDEEVASLMNDAFINIKVDREERPDIDNIYMSVTQMLNNRGGWPMTVIMTPEAQPFFAGTYFPKETRYGRIGMTDLVPKVKEMWSSSRDSLQSNALDIMLKLKNINKPIRNKGNIAKDAIEKSFSWFVNNFDEVHGGFKGGRNKFPIPHNYMFLSRYYDSTNDKRALEILEKSLVNMRMGGMYDQIGYGFHRYSTDKKWFVPHFEKMLYDQALLVHSYLDAYLVTKDNRYRDVVDEILEYVMRDMTSKNGGFYSAEDADSEGEEGTFYLWTKSEVNEILGESDGGFMNTVLNISSSGNWHEGKSNGTNIPYLSSDSEQLSKQFNISSSEFSERFNKCRTKLFLHREGRVHPQKDDKILTDWNGLMISAIARAGSVLNNKKYKKAALAATEFSTKNLISTDEKSKNYLYKLHRNGISTKVGLIEDYSFMLWAYIEMYQMTFDSKYLKISKNIADHIITHFWDKEGWSFYFTPDYGEELIVRAKEVYDGAIPSGNSVAAYNFIRLSRILSNPKYEDYCSKILSAYSRRLNGSGSGKSMMMQAVQYMNGPSYEVLVIGDSDSNQYKDLLNLISKSSQINKVVISYDEKKNTEIEELIPFITEFPKGQKGESVIYVCQDFSCQLPTSDINQALKQLENK